MDVKNYKIIIRKVLPMGRTNVVYTANESATAPSSVIIKAKKKLDTITEKGKYEAVVLLDTLTVSTIYKTI